MFNRNKNTNTWIALFLIALGVLSRVMPHPDNFTPTTSIALFAGMALPLSLALWVPLLLMMASDLFLGLHSTFWLVWVTFTLVVFIGIRLNDQSSAGKIFLSSVAGSLLFFVISNLGVFFVDHLYPMTWAGLVECFVMAIPFFKNSFAADLFYTFVFFGLYAVAKNSLTKKVIS